MSFTLDEVHAVLETAIVAARLADADAAGGFATALAGPTSAGLDELEAARRAARPSTEVVQVVHPRAVTGPTPVPIPLTADVELPDTGLLSMVEALTIRNRVAEAIGTEDHPSRGAQVAAERLLVLGYIDIGVVQGSGEPPVVTGAQVVLRVSEGTGTLNTASS